MNDSKNINRRGRDGSPPGMLPVAVLQERLSLSVWCPWKLEPVVVLQAQQEYYLLTHDEIRAFHRLLLAAQATMHRLSPPPPERQEETYEETARKLEATECSLYAKVHLTRRRLSLPWPGLLHLSAQTVTLRYDELTILEIDTTVLLQDIVMDEAMYCYACVPLAQQASVWHLVRKDRRAQRGPVLCGCIPPAQEVSAGPPPFSWWFFFPFTGRPAAQRGDALCQRCLELWQAEQ